MNYLSNLKIDKTNFNGKRFQFDCYLNWDTRIYCCLEAKVEKRLYFLNAKSWNYEKKNWINEYFNVQWKIIQMGSHTCIVK